MSRIGAAFSLGLRGETSPLVFGESLRPGTPPPEVNYPPIETLPLPMPVFDVDLRKEMRSQCYASLVVLVSTTHGYINKVGLYSAILGITGRPPLDIVIHMGNESQALVHMRTEEDRRRLASGDVVVGGIDHIVDACEDVEGKEYVVSGVQPDATRARLRKVLVEEFGPIRNLRLIRFLNIVGTGIWLFTAKPQTFPEHVVVGGKACILRAFPDRSILEEVKVRRRRNMA